MDLETVKHYLYEAENVIDELVIIALSFGAIFVAGYVLFISPGQMTFLDLGNTIYPWVVMLALMIIGRELWLIKNEIREYVNQG